MKSLLRDLVFLAWLAIPLVAALVAIRRAGDARYTPPDRLACAVAACRMCGP